MATPSPNRDRPPLQSGFRRSFTAPSRSLSFHEKAGLDSSDAAADVLYFHPSVRILKFSPPFSAIRSASSPIPSQDLDYPVDTIETLPWATATETTVASGLMKIEKVQGSTNFLKSGTVMHAIMRNSQCWCVDGESKFVLRIGKFQYYRIEFPTKTEEEKAKVEELKMVLKKILRFEVTPCPFKRGFHVELPESATTPRRKGTWKRRQSSQASSPMGETPPPISRARNLRTNMPLVATQSSEDGKEQEQDESGSEVDEHDTQSDSTEAEEDSAPQSPMATTSNPMADEARGAEEEVSEEEDPISSPSGLERNLEPSEPANALPSSIEQQAPQEPVVQPADLEDSEPEAVPAQSHPLTDAPIMSDAGEMTPEIGSTSEELLPLAAEAGTTTEDISTEGPDLPETVEEDVDGEEIPEEAPLERRLTDTMSIASSVTSFHSIASMDGPTSPPYPSPPPSDDGGPPSPTPHAESLDPLAMHSYNTHKREISEMTITPSSPRLRALTDHEPSNLDRPRTSLSDLPSTPHLIRSSASDASWPDVETPGSYATNQLRHRQKARRRSPSSLPPSSTIFAPSPQQDRNSHIAAAILQKACSIALGKPIELAVMLIHILAKIAGGATVNDLLNGELFKKPEKTRDHHRNRSLPDAIEGSRAEDSDEDDFGAPLRGRTKSTETTRDGDTDSLYDLD